MGKREKTKVELKQKILSAAKKKFFKDGYEHTTIGQIAEEAGVGLGTTYNFFSTKDDLLLAAMADILTETDPNQVVSENADEQPLDIISSLVTENLMRFTYFDKKIWQSAMGAIFSNMRAGTSASVALLEMDQKMMEKMKIILANLIKQGKICESFDINSAVELLYGAVIFQLMIYFYTENATFDDLYRKIESNIKLVIEPNVL
jgi:AcrR family transcriptional regulator